MSAVKGYTRSLGGMETPGLLVVTRILDVIVPECVSGAGVLKRASSVSEIACVNACMKMDGGPIQTGDMNSEPNGPLVSISITAPVPRDAAYEARSAFRERPSRARLRGGIPVRERPTFRKRPSRGRLKYRRGFEF